MIRNSINLSKSEEVKILARDKRYVTCLRLVELVVNRELGNLLHTDYYENLGKVASFIDRSLDTLKLSQKANLLEDFDSIFLKLTNSKNQEQFNEHIFGFIAVNKIQISYTLKELYAVRSFIKFQKKHSLLDELQTFGKKIIIVSIRQELALSSSEIITLLKQEGKLVLELLQSNLRQYTSEFKKLNQTIGLLTDFEQILNLGDDFLDVNEDIRKGKISARYSIFHRWNLMRLLCIQIVKTFFKNPIKCLHYYPRCSTYYLLNYL